MAGVGRAAERVPGWVERFLVPSLESKVRGIVKEEVAHLEKLMDARFDAVDSRIESLEGRFPMVQEIAEIKARLSAIERKVAR